MVVAVGGGAGRGWGWVGGGAGMGVGVLVAIGMLPVRGAGGTAAATSPVVLVPSRCSGPT